LKRCAGICEKVYAMRFGHFCGGFWRVFFSFSSDGRSFVSEMHVFDYTFEWLLQDTFFFGSRREDGQHIGIFPGKYTLMVHIHSVPV
jgi:hypothetical protein